MFQIWGGVFCCTDIFVLDYSKFPFLNVPDNFNFGKLGFLPHLTCQKIIKIFIS